MTIKSTVSFTDRHYEFAKKQMEEGVYASVSSMVASSIEQMMRDEEERNATLEAMKDTIAARMKTPKEQWIELNDQDSVFSSIKKSLESKLSE